MNKISIIFALCLLTLSTAQQLNLDPVIGIITIPMESWYPNPEGHSYIAASYVKFVEAGGARVIPIPWDAPNLTDYLNIVNGVLFTGGDSTIIESGEDFVLTPFGQALNTVYDHVLNSKDYYPLWGTCQGFEAIMYLASKNTSALTACVGCSGVSKNNQLENTQSRLLAGLPSDLLNEMQTGNISYFNQGWKLDIDFLQNNANVSDYYMITSTVDESQTRYVSAYENQNLPIYGTQFHQEKSTFEWRFDKVKNLNHDFAAVQFEQWLGNFFVNECRNNMHQFDDNTYDNLLIYSYNATIYEASPFSQIYIFDSFNQQKSNQQAQIQKNSNQWGMKESGNTEF